ncbi:MAG: GatB/YqeY domain-containing protein [Alphaproteobacteria bacterium]|nr:MAG: GatB/YqeY domain-containing protein [Alphaproteobacteria bacterium]
MSDIKTRLSNAVKESMKARNEHRTTTLRMVISEIKKRDIDNEIKGKPALNDTEAMAVLLTLVKQRKESATTFIQGGRQELADKENLEIAMIEEFLPKQLDESEAKAKIKAIIAEVGASSAKDMGKVMGVVKERLAGQVDMTKVSGWVKESLAA